MSRSDAVRLFVGFAGLGAAAVNLAVASSLFAAAGTDFPGTDFPGRAAGAAAALLWGAALLGWTVAGLSRNRFPMPRVSALLLPAAAAAHVAAIVLAAGSGMAGLGISHLAGLLLTLMILAATSWLGRRSPNLSGGPGQNTSGRLGAGTLLAAAFAGAVLVAAITTPGLAASTAGQFAVPHGEHTGSHHSP
ncbi:hypothetical protein G9E11_14740 [Arthrobacter sp. IA7]|nr:hypothetical protein [Arthrobacter ipis]